MYFILWKSICILFYGNLYVFYFMEIYMFLCYMVPNAFLHMSVGAEHGSGSRHFSDE